MTTDNTGGPTSAKVAKLATTSTRLARTALIGIFGSESTPGALVRTGDGAITRVTIGDRIAGGIVAAISSDALILSARGGNKVLKLPGA